MGVTRIGNGRVGSTRGTAEPAAPAAAEKPARTRKTEKADRFGGDTSVRTGSAVPVGVEVDASKPAKFKLDGSFKLDVPEPSGVVFLSAQDGFLVASDCEDKLYRVDYPKADDKKGKLDSDTIKADGGRKHLSGLEGIAYDPRTRSALVVSEERSEITEIPLNRRDWSMGKAEKLGKLPDISQLTNKGWEGLTLLPGSMMPDGKDRLLAVHEAAPRRLAILDRKTLEPDAVVKLSDAMKDGLKDLSDVAVDPRTGHLFILSDESDSVMEVALKIRTKPGEGGRPKQAVEFKKIGLLELPTADGQTRMQPEGLCFDDKGNLFVVAEKKQQLFRLTRQD